MENDEQGEDGTRGILALDRSLEDERKLYLVSGKYPERCKDEDVKRSFRRKAKKFRVLQYQVEFVFLYLNCIEYSRGAKAWFPGLLIIH